MITAEMPVVAERPIEVILEEVQQAVPELLNTLKADNAPEQRRAFLAGEIDNPEPHYDKLFSTDFESVDAQLQTLGQEIQDHPQVDKKYKQEYAEFISYRRKINQLLSVRKILDMQIEDENPLVMWAANVAKANAQKTYDLLNKELFGKVDQSTMHALLSNELADLKVDRTDELGSRILNELHAIVPQESLQQLPLPYEKDEATFTAMKNVVKALYGDLLDRHIPLDGDNKNRIYKPEEIFAIVQNVIRDFGVLKEQDEIPLENGERVIGTVNPDGWEAKVVKQKGISVDAKYNLVKVSPTITLDALKLRGLIVHELGVHMLRAIMGRQTDFLPLAIGMAGHMPTEEGTATVLQQAEVDTFEIAGAGHAITAGLLAATKSFRDTFEIKWRLDVLKKRKPGELITPEAIEKARDVAYTNTMRLAKGNGQYPVLKDLAYYNGTRIMWEYFKGFGGDELTTYLALMGKLDPTNYGQRTTAIETKAA